MDRLFSRSDSLNPHFQPANELIQLRFINKALVIVENFKKKLIFVIVNHYLNFFICVYWTYVGGGREQSGIKGKAVE